MFKIKILNSHEIKNICRIVKDQWDADIENNLIENNVFLINEKGKIYIARREIFNIDISKLKINSIGMYFGELKDGILRLSIEGSQIIGPSAKKNVVSITERNSYEWFKGEDLVINVKDANLNLSDGFVIVKCGNDFLGTGRYKDGKIKNFVQKARQFKYCVDIFE